MEMSPIVADDVSTNNNKELISDQIIPNTLEKRPLEVSEINNEKDLKKCKIVNDDGNNTLVEDGKESKNDDKANSKPISKTQMKKMLKQQRWLENKLKRKAMDKEKKKEKKNLKAKMRDSSVVIQKATMKKMSESTCKQRIVLDMSFNDLMSDKDLLKCCSQVLRCYSLNRRMENPMQLYFCSYKGKIKETMRKHDGSEFWDLKYTEESFDKVFEKEELVYLTSDSQNVLDTIDESKVYIIGGLVDHNSCKNASLKIAENLGIAHARFPIDKYINMLTRKVLTINQVFEIILKIVTGITWKDAFMNTIPKRKMISAKDEEISLICDGNSTNSKQVEEKNKC